MPNKPVTVGMVGENVAAVHHALAALGFNIPEAERKRRFFGPATRAAVLKCQAEQGVACTGEVDAATVAALSTPVGLPARPLPADAQSPAEPSAPPLSPGGRKTMKRITPPLRQNDQGEDVGNLQECLFLLLAGQIIKASEDDRRYLEEGLKREQLRQVYTEFTAKLVGKFQEQYSPRFTVTGEVDAPTADALNRILKEVGAIGPRQDGAVLQVKGKVASRLRAGVGGVISSAVTGSNAPVSTYAKRIPLSSTTPSQLNTRKQPVVGETNHLKPTHLSLFALQRNSGHPIARMPFYAEVGVTRFAPPPKPECKLKEAIRINLRGFYAFSRSYAYADTSSPAETFVEPLCDALSRLLGQETIDRIAGDPASAARIISAILQKAKDLAASKNIDPKDPEALRRLLEDAISAYAKEQDLPLAGMQIQNQQIVWAYPLGVLATDHVGYLSFDLTRLPPDVAGALALALEARRRDPSTPTDTSIWIYPMALEANKIDALAQTRFANDAIVASLELDVEIDPITCQPKMCEAVKTSGFLAMQNPSLTDWRLSPGSFSINTGGLVGADGCELVLPSNTALHEFNFHQVIGITNDVGIPIDPSVVGKVRPGFVNEYRLSLIPIGHSLGQIVYTFPLAPGESVNFAVIDWTRHDTALRNETTKLDESLVHELRRDRTITETVRASIDEWQRGGSLMGGQATSAGGAIGGSGMGAAVGASNALGGAYSTTSGSRDIAGDTIQKLSDNVVQQATSSRELYSTVVVQSSQAEHEAIETRTVVNYNHSHALTILYYEVVRHFRVVTEFVRRRPALLTNIHGSIASPSLTADPITGELRYMISWPAIYENRKVLEAALLDDRYKEGFDILQRREHSKRVKEVNAEVNRLKKDNKWDPKDPPSPPESGFRFFVFEMRTGESEAERGRGDDVQIKVNIALNVEPWWIALTGGGGPRFSPPGAFFQKNTTYWFTGHPGRPEEPALKPRAISWDTIEAIDIMVELAKGGEDWSDISFSFIKVTGIDVNGNETLLFERNYEAGHLNFDNNWLLTLPAKRPAPVPPPANPSAEWIEEEAKLSEFEKHLLACRPHYERALRLGAPPAIRAFELAGLAVGGGASLLEKVDNRPLEVLGDYVAYPCIDGDWSNKIMAAIKADLPEVEAIERLVTLPTRGVFAEAKLGHCNASEEIDNTRFWKWDEHAIPHLAPEIAAIQAGQHTVKDLDLKSTPFPQSMLNIVNPPSAPDPQGMAAAMTALATANIFRDMSGRAEVADLLKKLSDSSVAIAGVAQKAATGGASGTPSSGGGASGGTSSSGGSASTPPTGSTGVSSPPSSSQPQQQPPQTSEQRESAQIDNSRKTGQTAIDVLPLGKKRDKVLDKVADDLGKTKITWKVVFTSEWAGETIKEPMKGTYTGELFFGEKEESKILNSKINYYMNQWDVEHDKTPLSLLMIVSDYEPFTGGFSIAVPGITVEGLIPPVLKETTYDIPLRKGVSALPNELKAVVTKIQIKDKETALHFHGTGMIMKKEIEVIAEVNSSGELTGEFGDDFTKEATIEIVKLAVSSRLKAAVKTSIGGKAGIKGTFEILYFKGYKIEQL